MKMAANFTVSLYLSNVLCIKISTAETISSSCFVFNPCLLLKMDVYEIIKSLTYLMKLVNLDTAR
jgi:hypothetical protein